MTSPRQSGVVQRVLFPIDDAATPLYLRADAGHVSWTRHALSMSSPGSVSLDTYFGAFPAAVWMRMTGTRLVTFTGRVTGDARLRIHVRSVTGRREQASPVSDGAFAESIVLEAGDQWVWAQIDTDDRAVVEDLAWGLGEASLGSTAICITTHNRPADCLGVLEALGSDGVLELVDHVFVVDQGTRRLRDTQGFAAVADVLAGRLRVIEQPNLGGSGGFSRGMIEAAAVGADYAVLLDDDVRLEPESVRRLVSLAARTQSPSIVGAHMLDLVQPTRLHSWGERVDPARFEWTPIAPDLRDLDLGATGVSDLPADADVEFNGWWLCLIPTTAVRELGAALPMFIKWDDTEYSLRAAAAGIPTVTLPGAALWHMPWTVKDDGLDWQAYFQLRNRIVTALLHAPERRAGAILRATFALDANHLLCMQYGSAAARRQALTDVLHGPQFLAESSVRRPAEVGKLMVRAGQVVVTDTDVPAPASGEPLRPPSGAAATLVRLIRVLVHQCRRPRPVRPGVVDRRLERADGKWWALGLLDSAAVASATGAGSFVARRDRRTAGALLRDAVLLRLRLRRQWRTLAHQYRSAARDLASAEAWTGRFDDTGPR